MFLKSFLKVELSNINHYCDFAFWLMPLFIEQAVVYSLWCSPGALIEGNQLHSQQCCQHVHSGLLTGKESLSMEWEFFAQIKPQFKHLPTFPTSMQVYCIFYRYVNTGDVNLPIPQIREIWIWVWGNTSFIFFYVRWKNKQLILLHLV